MITIAKIIIIHYKSGILGWIIVSVHLKNGGGMLAELK